MRRNMSGNLGLYKYLWPGSVSVLIDKILRIELTIVKNEFSIH